jgi:hypothetical protein
MRPERLYQTALLRPPPHLNFNKARRERRWSNLHAAVSWILLGVALVMASVTVGTSALDNAIALLAG